MKKLGCKNKKSLPKMENGAWVNSASMIGSTLGPSIYSLSNLPDQQSSEVGSAIGMGMQGASAGAAFGPWGAAIGGVGGLGMGFFTAKKRNIEMEAARQQAYNAYLANSTVNPTRGFKKGGKIKGFQDTGTYMSDVIKEDDDYIIPQMFGEVAKGQTPLVHIQAEKGEKIIMPDGGIVDTKATKSHEQMSKDFVTDVLPEGAYVASKRKNQSIKKIDADKIVLGHTPIQYDEFNKYDTPKEITLGDILNKSEVTPAEIANLIKNKFKTVDKSRDVFTEVTNEENKIGRMPYLMRLIAMKEKAKYEGMAKGEGVVQAKKGMKVKKYQEDGIVEGETFLNPNSKAVGNSIFNVNSTFNPKFNRFLTPLGQGKVNDDVPFTGGPESTDSLASLYENYGQQLGAFNKKYQQEYSDYYKYARGANASANLLGAFGTALQSSDFTPSLRSTRYADEMFKKTPQYLRESNKTETLAPLYSIARNQGVLNVPTSTSMSRLAPLYRSAIGQLNATNTRYNLDDLEKDSQKYRYMQSVEDFNAAQLANADNMRRRQDNYKISQGIGFGGRALTQDATLKGQELNTKMNLERQAIDSPLSIASQLEQLRMMNDMLKKQKQGI